MAPKTVKKPVAKKTVAKTTKATAPLTHECACGGHCHCAHNHGCKCGHVIKKIVVFAIIFALGFAAARFCPNKKHHPRMPRVQFENGCLVVESVKCPKLLEKVATMDADNNGCISREEYRKVKRHVGFKKPRGERPMHRGPAPIAK